MNSGTRMRPFKGWQVLASAALVAGLAGCGSATSAPVESSGKVDTVLAMPDLKGKEVVVNTFGGTFGDALKKTVVEPFEAATGAKVTVVTTCCDTLSTQVKAGQFAGDIVFGSDPSNIWSWAEQGLLKSDPRLLEIGKAHNLNPEHYQDNAFITGYLALALAWNTKNKDNHPGSWTEFVDGKKFTGTRGLSTYPQGNLEVGLLGTGTPASALYPIDVDKAMDGMTTLRSNAKLSFWQDGADSINKLSTGEMDYAMVYSNRAVAAIQDGLPIDLTFNQAITVGTASGIPATAQNVDGAVALLDFALQPSVQAAFAKASGIAPASSEGAAMVDSDLQKYMVTTPSNLSQTVQIDYDWWITNGAKAEEIQTKWMSGQ